MITQLMRFKRLDKQLMQADSLVPFTLINPTNEKQEKKKFFESDSYEPQFKYVKLDPKLKKVKKDVKKLKFKDSVLDNVFQQKQQKILDYIEMLELRGDQRFTGQPIKIYGNPDEELLRAARKLVAVKDDFETDQIIPLSKVKRMFKFALLKHGFNWKIKEKDMPAMAAVLASKRILYLRKGASFSLNQVKRLIVHEIGTHVLRAENGAQQPFKIFRHGLPGYLMTEEGLAVYNEEKNNLQTKKSLKTYAGRVLAIDHALHTGFRATYKFLSKWFDQETAWRLTVRAKRGLKDTHQPGAFTKDLAYLKGYLAVREYVEQDGSLEKLYYGKVGIEHVELLEKIPYLIHPKILPVFKYVDFVSDILTGILEFGFNTITSPLRRKK